MIFDSNHEITLDEQCIQAIQKHILEPQHLNGKTLFVTWKEERVLDSAFGMMWSLMIAQGIVRLFKLNKYDPKIGTRVTFPNDEGCLVTFRVT